MKFADQLEKLASQHILILGLGAEGWSTYQFLRRQLPELPLTIADQRELKDFEPHQQETLANDSHLATMFGDDYLKEDEHFDVIFKTPGIAKTLPAVKKIIGKNTKLASNTQLFFELCSGTIIGVTGTKGKSTTAAVIHHVLKAHGLNTQLVGNIGQPALDFLEEMAAETLVVYELSSHQLETLTVSPHIAVVQNVTSEHLDYYPDTATYRAAKSSITRFQRKDDWVVYNPEFEGAAEIASLSHGEHLRFGLKQKPDLITFVRGEALMYKDPANHVTEVIKLSDLPLLGQHNLFNVMPAIIIGARFNMDPAEIGEALKTFKPLPHRLELFLDKNGVKYYDDSLATMPDAAVSALRNFSEPIVLLAGGYERNQDFTELAQTILQQKVVGLVLFNPTGERIMEALKNAAGPEDVLPQIEFAENMPEAAKKIKELTPSWGGVVLMSPASASFGMFKNYHDRGEQFKTEIKKIV